MSASPRVVYLDNAATSWPKPPQVVDAMRRFLTEVGANPGRSGHRQSVEAARTVFRAREAVARLVGLEDPLRVVFGANATHALNLALQGLLRPGQHVVTTAMEHNSVMRPLRALESRGVALTVAPCSPEGVLDPAGVERALRPETALVVLTHASNVVGTILPVGEVAAIARRHGALVLTDAAQSLGALPLALGDLGADLLAFTGHKALLGPMGTEASSSGSGSTSHASSRSSGAARGAARSRRPSPSSCPTSTRAARRTWSAWPGSRRASSGCSSAGWRSCARGRPR